MSITPKEGRKFFSLGKKVYIQTVNIFLPPLAHFHTGRYAGKKHHFILDTFLALMIFALAAFAVYERSQIHRLFVDDIGVSVTADTAIRAGQEQAFTVALKNQTRGILRDIAVRLLPDEQFVFSGEAPIAQIAELAAGETSSSSFPAAVFGLPEEVRRMKVVVTYVQASDRRGQTTVASLTIAETLLGMSVTMPTMLSSGQAGELTIAPTEKTFREGGIRLESSSPVSISRHAEQKNYAWSVRDNTPPLHETIRFSSESLGEQPLTIIRFATIHGKEVVTDRKQFSVNVIRPEAKLSVVAGSDTLDANASTSVTVTATNTGEYDIREMVVICAASGAQNRVAMSGADAVVSKNTIAFSHATIKELSLLVPGSSVILTWVLTGSESSEASNRDATISCSLAGAQRRDETDIPVTIYAEAITITVLPFVSFQTYALYTGVGAGPLPPRVGLPTLYRLFFSATHSSHAVTSLTVTTSLPKGVIWAGNASALAGAAPTFDEATRTIQWVVADPLDDATLEASFDAQLVPNANHIGALLPLLDSAELAYTVTGVRGTVTKTAPLVTTELTNDPEAHGKGRVAP